MGLREGDLRDTILSKLSLDEFEPKTGDNKDVVVCGFGVIDKNVGNDLSVFLNNASYFENIRDVEVSPNRNDDGNFMVFVELDRNENSMKFIQEMISDIERISGKLKWEASTHLTDNFYPLGSDELNEYFISDPENYVSREEFDERIANEQARVQEQQNILSFLKDSDLHEVSISEGKITLRGLQDSATLEIVAFGEGNNVMKQVGIHESAIDEMDYDLRMFNRMLGNMRALRISEHVVIYHPNSNQVLITK